MWGLGLLLLVFLYISIATGVASIFPRAKFWVNIIFLAMPFLLAFSFCLAPSFYQFINLCSQSSRFDVIKNVDIEYIPEFGSCGSAYEVMSKKNYLGFECKKVRSLARYTKNDKFVSVDCQTSCAIANIWEWERKCLEQCFSELKIDDLSESVGFRFRYKSNDLLEGRIREIEQSVLDRDEEVLARVLNYQYYLYGNGLAKILGGDSGDAPVISCSTEYDIFSFDFLEDKHNKLR